MEWMLMPLRRYADFTGRSRRKEYWMFVLFQVLIYIPLVVIMIMFGAVGRSDGGGGTLSGTATMFLILLVLLSLALFIPSLAVQVRRLHDTDRSGWWVLLGLIPVVNYIGLIVLLVFYCLEGTKGDNRFGPDPKLSQNVGDVFN